MNDVFSFSRLAGGGRPLPMRPLLYELGALFGLLVVCVTPVVCREVVTELSLGRMLSSVLYSLPLCCLLLAVKNKWAFGFLVVLMLVCSSMETVMAVLYGNYLIAGNLIAVFTTTQAEGSGFLLSALPTLPAVLPVWAGAILALALHKKGGSSRHAVGAFLLSAMACVLFLFCQIKIKWGGVNSTEFYVEQNLLSRPPYNFAWQLVNVYKQQQTKKFIAEARNMSYGATRPSYKGKETYVLAIGESVRYDNLSLAGYQRTTTPLLETLDNLILYSDYFSTANLTMYSVPQILTRATPEDFALNYKEKSVYRPFQECGFKTFFICTDNLLSYERYLSDGSDGLYALPHASDSRIAELVDSLSSCYEKTFFVVQFKGNHSPYTNFPKSCDRYRPNPVSDKVAWDNFEAMVNAYDNTVLFMDYNLFHIIKAIDREGARSAFMMVSDHGADYTTGCSDHGGNCMPRKAEYHVPLMFWGSRTWDESYARKRVNALRHKDAAVNADNVFYSVLDMADIRIPAPYAHPSWSIFADRLAAHERRLLVPDGQNTIVVR